eukprot:3249452-Prymnesium_polylepis.1
MGGATVRQRGQGCGAHGAKLCRGSGGGGVRKRRSHALWVTPCGVLDKILSLLSLFGEVHIHTHRVFV